MPNYDFTCTQCGKTFDRLLPMAERDNELQCPECGGTARRNAVNSFGCSTGNSGSQPAPSGGCCGGCCHHR